MLNKVAVVGAGNVGATAAQRLAEKNLARTVVMIDVVDGVPQGKGLDQWQSGPVEGFDTRIVGSGSYDDAAGAELFVVTAGIARKPGMSRDDLVKTNAGIVRSVSEQIARIAPKSIIIVVSNPLDVMCYVALKTTRFPRERILGMAGVLDTARYRTFLAQALDISVEDIQAMVLGGHGDTMVPLVSYTTVSGIPVSQLIDREKLDAIYYAPSAAAVQMVEAVALDRKRILPCSVWLQGEYGLRDIFCGVPCKLGRAGLEQILQVTLTDAERDELRKSAEAVRSTQAVVDL
jgi:malate dehydrogenase